MAPLRDLRELVRLSLSKAVVQNQKILNSRVSKKLHHQLRIPIALWASFVAIAAF
jgi:hypothetical protein